MAAVPGIEVLRQRLREELRDEAYEAAGERGNVADLDALLRVFLNDLITDH